MQGQADYKRFAELGRTPLSETFFMREFLFSDISGFFGRANVPEIPELAVKNGVRLCQELLEPLQSKFGRISVRSGYRSPDLNKFCNENKLGCANNENNAGAHIWDHPHKKDGYGAMACVALPWLKERIESGMDWRVFAYWVHLNLPYSQLELFGGPLWAFNIGWNENPRKRMRSYIAKDSGLFDPDVENAKIFMRLAMAL
jgi:hypothetical protein